MKRLNAIKTDNSKEKLLWLAYVLCHVTYIYYKTEEPFKYNTDNKNERQQHLKQFGRKKTSSVKHNIYLRWRSKTLFDYIHHFAKNILLFHISSLEETSFRVYVSIAAVLNYGTIDHIIIISEFTYVSKALTPCPRNYTWWKSPSTLLFKIKPLVALTSLLLGCQLHQTKAIS